MSQNEDEQSSSTRSEDIVPRFLKYWRFLWDQTFVPLGARLWSDPMNRDRKTPAGTGAINDLVPVRIADRYQGVDGEL